MESVENEKTQAADARRQAAFSSKPKDKVAAALVAAVNESALEAEQVVGISVKLAKPAGSRRGGRGRGGWRARARGRGRGRGSV